MTVAPYTHYTDAEGRRLAVLEVDFTDRLGRNVRGVLCRPPCGAEGRVHDVHPDYACDLKTWEAVWRDKAPPTPRSQMKVGG